MLKLEVNKKFTQSEEVEELASMGVLVTPFVGKDYWLFRVKLDKGQAILGFPKFNTTGIGFAKESDWNTNLPYTCSAEEIYNHIKHNKKPSKATKQRCIRAIEMIKEAANKLKETGHDTKI